MSMSPTNLALHFENSQPEGIICNYCRTPWPCDVMQQARAGRAERGTSEIPMPPTLNQAVAVLRANTAEHRGDFGIYHEGVVHCITCRARWPCPTMQAGERLIAALETHVKLEHDCDQLEQESRRLEDGILRALDQIVGWVGQPTSDPVEIVARVRAILEEALVEPAVPDGT